MRSDGTLVFILPAQRGYRFQHQRLCEGTQAFDCSRLPSLRPQYASRSGHTTLACRQIKCQPVLRPPDAKLYLARHDAVHYFAWNSFSSADSLVPAGSTANSPSSEATSRRNSEIGLRAHEAVYCMISVQLNRRDTGSHRSSAVQSSVFPAKSIERMAPVRRLGVGHGCRGPSASSDSHVCRRGE